MNHGAEEATDCDGRWTFSVLSGDVSLGVRVFFVCLPPRPTAKTASNVRIYGLVLVATFNRESLFLSHVISQQPPA